MPPMEHVIGNITTMLILRCLVECIRRSTPALVGSQHGHTSGIFLYYWECDAYRGLYARPCGTGKDNHASRNFLILNAEIM